MSQYIFWQDEYRKYLAQIQKFFLVNAMTSWGFVVCSLGLLFGREFVRYLMNISILGPVLIGLDIHLYNFVMLEMDVEEVPSNIFNSRVCVVRLGKNF